MNKEDLLENIAQHTCSTCEGHGELADKTTDGSSFIQLEYKDCPDCENGFVNEK